MVRKAVRQSAAVTPGSGSGAMFPYLWVLNLSDRSRQEYHTELSVRCDLYMI